MKQFNRDSFITLNANRLFTAKEVCNIIREFCPECEKKEKEGKNHGF